MNNRIQVAMKEEKLVTLADVKRGEKGLTCHTCGDNLAVKDGGGERVSGKTRRNQARRKHFSHIANSKCHGEGPAHYKVKTVLCLAINYALKMSRENRNFHGQISYRCKDAAYGPRDMMKVAPGSEGPNQEFEQLRHGYHHYDLLHDYLGRKSRNSPGLDRAECEVWLDGRRTRADIAGKDKDGNVLWIIEIKRTGLSNAAVEHAREKGIPLFVVDLSHLPQATEENPLAETECWAYWILADNLTRGFYPSVTESYNTKCERKALGMGPDDYTWSTITVYEHRGQGDCDEEGCPECEEIVLHGCSAMVCPDSEYMFAHGIDPVQMYTDPTHSVHSHKLVAA